MLYKAIKKLFLKNVKYNVVYSKGKGFLEFGRNLGEILPTSLPELPIQLRDLRNSQKSLNTYCLRKTNKTLICGPGFRVSNLSR